MKDSVKKCRFCGKPVSIITWGFYRKVVVDAEAVMIYADPDGEEFVRIDGTKVRGSESPIDCRMPVEPAYRPHRMSCGV